VINLQLTSGKFKPKNDYAPMFIVFNCHRQKLSTSHSMKSRNVRLP